MAKRSALLGEFAAACASLQALLSKFGECPPDEHYIFTRVLHVALLTQQLDTAAEAINRRFRTGNWFRIVYEDRRPQFLTVVSWGVTSLRSVLVLSNELRTSPRFDFVINRLIGILPICSAYHQCNGLGPGEIQISLEDHSTLPGLAFCDNRPEFYLISDPLYLLLHAYADILTHSEQQPVAWHDRKPVAFRRGSTTGRITDPALGWRSLPRTRLCEISRQHSDIMDTGIRVAPATASSATAAPRDSASSGKAAGARPFRPAGRWPTALRRTGRPDDLVEAAARAVGIVFPARPAFPLSARSAIRLAGQSERRLPVTFYPEAKVEFGGNGVRIARGEPLDVVLAGNGGLLEEDGLTVVVRDPRYLNHYFNFLEILIGVFAFHRQYLGHLKVKRPHSVRSPGTIPSRTMSSRTSSRLSLVTWTFSRPGLPGAPPAGPLHRLPPRALTPPAKARLFEMLGNRFGSVDEADFATMPWRQQLEYSSRLDLLVGLHGSGLTNLLWLPPHSVAIEIFQ